MKKIIVFVSALAMSSVSFASLYARDLDGDITNGHEAVYDDVLDVTWLANAALSLTENFGADVADFGSVVGRMYGDQASVWIDGMNSEGYLGRNNWRLPHVEPLNGAEYNYLYSFVGGTDVGYNISAPVDGFFNPNGRSAGATTSELAYHFYNNFGAIGMCNGDVEFLGCPFSSNIFGIQNASNSDNIELFENIQRDIYWTGTVYTDAPLFLDSLWIFGMQQGNQFGLDEGAARYFTWPLLDGDQGVAVVPLPTSAWFFLSAIGGLVGFRKFK